MSRIQPVLTLALTFALSACTSFRTPNSASPPRSLEEVNQLLHNHPARIELYDGRVFGRVKAFQRIAVDSTVWIDYGNHRKSVATSEVSRIMRRAELTSGAGFALGLLAGAGLGAGAYAYEIRRCEGMGCMGAGYLAVLVAAVGGVAGLFIGGCAAHVEGRRGPVYVGPVKRYEQAR